MKIQTQMSPNFRAGRSGQTIKGITYHITDDENYGQARRWLCDPASQASAHYLIERNGEVWQLVADNNTSWAQGVIDHPTSALYFDMGSINPNSYMLSIEVVAKANQKPTVEQWASLLELTKLLTNKYNITQNDYYLIGHDQLNQRDKSQDPISSYTIKQILEGIKVKDYKQILMEKTSNPNKWIEIIEDAQKGIIKLDNVGTLKFLKDLIEKIGQ